MAKYASSFTGHPYYAYREKSPVPAGVVLDYTGTVLPSGFLWASGGLYLKASYPQLYARIGDTYATQVNPTTGVAYSAPAAGYFRVPDLRGVYTRGTGTSNTGVSVGLGQWLDDATALNGMTFTIASSGAHTNHTINNLLITFKTVNAGGGGSGYTMNTSTNLTSTDATYPLSGSIGGGAHTHPITIANEGTETRPVTIGVNKIIKVYDVTVVAGGDSGGGPGGLVPFLINPSITSWTAEDGFSYIVAPDSTLTLSLPTGTDKYMLEVIDAADYINATNYVLVAPTSGQSIDALAVDDRVKMDYAGAAITVMRADSSTHNVLKKQATTTAPPASATVEGLITTGQQEIEGEKTFLKPIKIGDSLSTPVNSTKFISAIGRMPRVIAYKVSASATLTFSRAELFENGAFETSYASPQCKATVKGQATTSGGGATYHYTAEIYVRVDATAVVQVVNLGIQGAHVVGSGVSIAFSVSGGNLVITASGGTIISNGALIIQ